MSPLPLVRSHRLPNKSVNCLGSFPMIQPATKFLGPDLYFSPGQPYLQEQFPTMAVRNILELYFVCVPSKPGVYPGDTTGSASPVILPLGSLKAPSPYTMTSICLPVSSLRTFWISITILLQSWKQFNTGLSSHID